MTEPDEKKKQKTTGTNTTLHPLKSENRAHDHIPSIETLRQQEISIWNDSQGNLDPHAPPLKNETTPDGLLRNENSSWKHVVLFINTVNDRNGTLKSRGHLLRNETTETNEALESRGPILRNGTDLKGGDLKYERIGSDQKV